jgi:diacylglycerol kinase family enzyme
MSSTAADPPFAAIVYNPTKVPRERIVATVETNERENGWRPSRWYRTSSADSGRQAARDALSGGPAVVLVAGGDGIIRVVAEAADGSGVPLAVLPAGTGNLLARNLGVPLKDPAAAIAAAFGGATRTIDTGLAMLDDGQGATRRHLFLVMAGLGLDAEMAETTTTATKQRLGWLAYVLPIARSIIRNHVFGLHYRVDGGRVRSARAHTIIVGNCGTLTSGMLLLPAARLDDGLLDVVMLRPKTRFGWVGIGTRLTVQGLAHRTGIGRETMLATPDLEALAYAQGSRFDVRFETPHAVQLDGDSVGPVSRARITVRPGSLTVRVPVAVHER